MSFIGVDNLSQSMDPNYHVFGPTKFFLPCFQVQYAPGVLKELVKYILL